jgi:hypothetical protein
MKRVVAFAALVVIVSAALPMVSAAASGRTFVQNNCRHRVKIRPQRIMFACADGAFYVTGLDWGRWHRFRATGHGLFHQNDCRPSCAEGTFHTIGGRLLLKHRRHCPRFHHYIFTRALITFDSRFLGRRRIRTTLPCPD